MGPLLGTLSFLSLVAMVLGLVKPAWLRLKNRKRAVAYYGLGFIVLFVVGVALPSSPSASPSATVAQNQPPSTSIEDQIRTTVGNVLSGQSPMSGENRLRNVDVAQQASGGWGVFVEFNADDGTKDVINKEMADIYIALYTSGKDIRTASAAAYFPLMDQYGNTSDVMVYKSILDGTTASKVNWSADKATLEFEILPQLWTTTILSPTVQ